MTNKEAVNWIINLSADIGKSEHRELWHYEQALSEIRETLESEPQWIPVSSGELPQDSYWVNVTVLDESGDGRFMYTSVGWYLSDGTWIVDNEPMHDDGSIRVIAWMPLPEPWKE